MASFLPTHFDRATVIAPDATPSGSAYRVVISANRHGAGADASLTLSDTDGHTILWSKSWNVPDASAVDLRQQVSRSASQVALCLTEARGGQERLVQPALGLYLAGCAGISDSDWSDEALLAQFEKIVKLAPKFSRGWDYLAIGRSVAAATQQENRGSPDSAAIKSAQAAIATARRLNPQSGLPYMAEAILLSDDYLKGLALLERGAALEPSNALLQSELTSYLQAVGRMTDAVATAQRAVELDPVSSLVRANYIIALTYAGQFSRVRTDIAEARKKWPNDPQIDFAEFGFHYRYGDPATAEKLLPRALPYSDARLLSYRKILAARLDPTPAKVEDAINAWNRPGDAKRLNQYLLALGLFGKVDEVYALLAQPRFRPVADPDILFRPEFAAVRADRRFIPVAARLGLTAYWSKSGIWPDFCSAERLPYDCKTEAAKYR
jgi:Flp pilus assembly protein TadD